MKKENKLKIYILIAVVLVAIFVLFFTSGQKLIPSEKQKSSTSVTAEEGGFLPVSEEEVFIENEKVSLVMDTATTHFTVQDKKSGAIYYSITDVEADKAGTKKYSSELILDYYDSDSMIYTMYSQDNSVAFETYEIEASEDAIRVYYDIRSRQDSLFVPKVFTKEVFEERIVSNLEAGPARRMKLYYRLYNSDNKDMVEQYSDLENQELYILIDGLTEQDHVEITDFFKDLNYTLEDYKKDIVGIENAYEGVGEDKSFLVPVEYKLTEDGFSARVLADQIESRSSSVYLANVYLLPSFAGLSEEREGYLFVPDGSGGIVSFTKNLGAVYSQQLYGIDYAVDDQLTLQISENAIMPVFGMNRGDSGFLAIIEDAAECATIQAQVFGDTNLGTSIYAGFQLLTHDVTDIAIANDGMPFFNLYSKEMNDGLPSVRYVLLEEEHCDYSAMAQSYREYLVAHEILTKRIKDEGTVMYLDYTGYTTDDASFFGIPYDEEIPLSTMEDILEYVERLHDEGIDAFSVRLKDYTGGGTNNGLVDEFDIEKIVGNGKQVKQLAEMLHSKNQTFYLDHPLGRVYKDTMFDAFNRLDHGSRRVNKMVITRGDFDIVLDRLGKRHNDYYLLSPKYYQNVVETFVNSLESELGNTKQLGYSWSLFGRTLSADYNMGETITRGQAVTMAQNALASVEDFQSMMTDGGNMYVLPYADTIVNLPMSGSDFGTVTEAIPFYQMVVHGYVNYAGAALNTVSDSSTEFLKSIEGGASLYYSCMTEDYKKIKDLSYRQKLYPVSMELCYDNIVAQYQEYEELFTKLASQLIVRHDILQEGVHMTTYEDGTVVLVNYNKEPVTVNDTIVEAKNYKVNP